MNQTNFQRLPEDNTTKVLEALPWAVRQMLRKFPQLFIAGGFIRAVLAGEPVKDIDIFTTDLSIVNEAVDFYVDAITPLAVCEKSRTPCTITVKAASFTPVQFINNAAYETPFTCLEQFDFTVCQAAVWHNAAGWWACCTPEFIRDVADKRLVYTAPVRVEAPGGSLWRAFKYAQRGYSITQEELTKLVMRLNMATWQFKQDDDAFCYDAEEHTKVISRSFSMGSGGYF